MKKFVAILMICVLTVSAFVGCGKKDEAKKIYSGALKMVQYDEKEFEEYAAKRGVELEFEQNGVKYHSVIKEYDNLSTMLMALKKGEIVNIFVPSSIGKYITATNEDVMLFDASDISGAVTEYSGYAFMFNNDKQELRDRFDEALISLVQEGKMKELLNKYITRIDYNQPLPKIEIPSFPGAETVKVAITGDLPPMDYIDEEGNPAGFNTALLAEIANILEINIEFVSIDSASRTIALTSGKADITFWTQATPLEEVVKQKWGDKNYDFSIQSIGEMFDQPDGTIISKPYFVDYIVYLFMKK